MWALVPVLFVAHFLLHVALSLGAEAPDLLTVGLLIAAREGGLGRAAALGLAFGLVEDALSAVAFGANSVAMTIVGVGGAFTRDLFVGDSRLFFITYFWVGKWLRDLLHWVAEGEEFRQPFVDGVVVQGALGGAYAAAVGLALVTMLRLRGETP